MTCYTFACCSDEMLPNLPGLYLEEQKMVRPTEFESVTFRSGGERSIQLSYGRMRLQQPEK